ncbi:tRNA lysidine(34) synthetase TilS [Chryseobacterium sp. SNU WT5]|nr:tRNA lysidine(34) synthetase TilS [Chryseobacterium sp. SNU WT5]
MVLMQLFNSVGLYFEVAHVNYGLRAQDSEKDQKLVEKICKQNNIPMHLYKVTAKDKKPENSIQDWARTVRYDFFRTTQKEYNLDFIVTAHHLNDQLETFLINLSKASGINGLTGIPANENKLLRPLLRFTKEDIYDFAKQNQIDFREDLSNQKSDYLRNKIRNKIVPDLLQVNENFLENFSKSLNYLHQTKKFVHEQISAIENKITTKDELYLSIDKKAFKKQTAFVQFEILRKYGFTDLLEIEKINRADTGKKFISSQYELVIDRETYFIKTLAAETSYITNAEFTLECNAQNEINIPFQFNNKTNGEGGVVWKLNKEKVHLPLKLRQKKEGDFFHPIGMIGKKKISKFFKDEKIPILAQQKTWLLCDADEQILGIIPLRQDRRFLADNESAEIITVKL